MLAVHQLVYSLFIIALVPAVLSELLGISVPDSHSIHGHATVGDGLKFRAVSTECCVTGSKHQGVPIGHSITLGPMNTYISEPSREHSGKQNRVIIFASDVFSPFALNNELLQDQFAAEGYTVLGPDYFFGDSAANHTTDSQEWIASVVQPAKDAFPPWLEAVKTKFGSPTETQYFAVGYCFGGPFSLGLAATDDVLAAAVAHPSLVTDEDFQSLTKPVLLSCAELDATFTLPIRRRAEDILIAKNASYHIQVFSNVTHGFATRGNLTDENARFAKEESERGIAAWFDRFSAAAIAQ